VKDLNFGQLTKKQSTRLRAGNWRSSPLFPVIHITGNNKRQLVSYFSYFPIFPLLKSLSRANADFSNESILL